MKKNDFKLEYGVCPSNEYGLLYNGVFMPEAGMSEIWNLFDRYPEATELTVYVPDPDNPGFWDCVGYIDKADALSSHYFDDWEKLIRRSYGAFPAGYTQKLCVV